MHRLCIGNMWKESFKWLKWHFDEISHFSFFFLSRNNFLKVPFIERKKNKKPSFIKFSSSENCKFKRNSCVYLALTAFYLALTSLKHVLALVWGDVYKETNICTDLQRRDWIRQSFLQRHNEKLSQAKLKKKTITVNSRLADTSLLRTLTITGKIQIPIHKGLTENYFRYYGLSLFRRQNGVPKVRLQNRCGYTHHGKWHFPW